MITVIFIILGIIALIGLSFIVWDLFTKPLQTILIFAIMILLYFLGRYYYI